MANPIRVFGACVARFRKYNSVSHIPLHSLVSVAPFASKTAVETEVVQQDASAVTSSIPYILSPLKNTENGSTLKFTTNSGLSSKSLKELWLSSSILAILRFPVLTQNASRLLDLSNRVLGVTLTKKLLKLSVFKLFCGGETIEDAAALVETFSSKGIGSILGYTIEHVAPSEASANAEDLGAIFARVYSQLLECAAHSTSTAGVAIKLTALCSPADLTAANSVLLFLHNLYGQMIETSEVSTFGYFMTGHNALQRLNRVDFMRHAEKVFDIDCDLEGIFDDIAAIDEYGDSGKDTISYFQWMKYFSLDKLSAIKLLKGHQEGSLEWTAKNVEDWVALKQQCIHVLEIVQRNQSFAVIDAEQTYLQIALDFFTLQLQEHFNRDRCVVFNTYQAYRKDTLNRVATDLQRARQSGIVFGVKLVRGAYMEEERRLARENKLIDPIRETLEDTHYAYNHIVELLVANFDRLTLIMASHNEASIVKAVNLIYSQGKDPKSVPLHFAQLLGMSDHVTYSLSNLGFSVFKYVPYGPVEETVPFLIRRAEENLQMLQSSRDEFKLVNAELRRRLFWSNRQQQTFADMKA